MSHRYGYNRRVHGYYYIVFRRYMFIIWIVVILGVIAAAWLIKDVYLNSKQSGQPVSKLETRTVGDGTITYKTAYFQFKDSGKWVFSSKESSDSKYVYYKYRGIDAQRQLEIDVNQTPIPLYLAATRVLPVHIVNGKNLEPVDVSGPCVSAYSSSDLHQEKEITLGGSTILCNPDSPRYVVVLGEVGGDYRIKMQRSDGSMVQFVMIYRDLTLDPGPDTLKNIVSSFQAV